MVKSLTKLIIFIDMRLKKYNANLDKLILTSKRMPLLFKKAE